jgi:hypothetical protein
MADPWEDPRAQEWRERANRELLPKIKGSAFVVSVNPGEDPDAKIAVETGMAILLDKPIILFSPPGRYIPQKLRQVADAIITGDPSSPETQRKFTEAIERLGLL